MSGRGLGRSPISDYRKAIPRSEATPSPKTFILTCKRDMHNPAKAQTKQQNKNLCHAETQLRRHGRGLFLEHPATTIYKQDVPLFQWIKNCYNRQFLRCKNGTEQKTALFQIQRFTAFLSVRPAIQSILTLKYSATLSMKSRGGILSPFSYRMYVFFETKKSLAHSI